MACSIDLDKLYVYFPVKDGAVKAVDGITLSIGSGTYTAIVGESGCGKSVLGQAILGVLPTAVQKSGTVGFGEYNLLENLPNNYYGKIISVVPQNPSESLNPIRSIKKQMLDALLGKRVEAPEELLKDKLRYFGLKDVERVLSSFPYELSGGMQQRVLCAMGLLKNPDWVLADEPTKGLDQETANIVYENLAKIKNARDCGMIIITHDIELAHKLCDKIAVMYSGQILEFGAKVLESPKHPYTKAFIAALPENGFQVLEGMAPSPKDELQGCKFAPRCQYCMSRCLVERPGEIMIDDTMVRCFLYAES